VSRFASGSAVAAAVLALAVAGCGGSSKKSTSSSKSTASPATSATASGATTTTSTTGGKPLSKAAYEAKLGPLLNGQVVPALRSALSNGGATNPQKLGTAVHLIDEARDAMASLTPPTRVADLNQAAVTTLGALAADMTKMKQNLQAHNKTAYVNAARQSVRDALKLQNVGNELSARGY
jgi:hypothetical protein